MPNKRPFTKDDLNLDCDREVDRITVRIREAIAKICRRRGVVIGVSGGIDSSVTLALCVKALGKDRVAALLMPERDSDSETLRLSRLVSDHFGIPAIEEDITRILEAVGFYSRYIEAVRNVVKEYGEDWKSKIVSSVDGEKQHYTFFSIVVQSPDGKVIKKRLPLKAYLEVVAATSFKQRTRKMMEYYHADRLHFAVAGTPNRLEYDQGFFVKNGDGAADIKPIAHLYKTQVYQLAEYLDIPLEIRKRPPTTDTYSLPQGQDEFYFSLPYDKMDLCLYGKNNHIGPDLVGRAIGLTEEQVEKVYKDIDQKRSTTKYLHEAPILIEKIRPFA